MKSYITLCLFIFLFSLNSKAQVKLNPEISLNSLFLVSYGSGGNDAAAEEKNGFQLQEAELRLTSNIDAYFRGDIILAVEKEDGEFIVEPEEAFIETLSIPNFTVRFGKFFPYWGRSNQWHTHALPFIDANQTKEIFGEEGFNEVGISGSYLLPLSWYSEIIVQAFSAENELVFGSAGNDDLIGVYFFKNLWDLNSTSTLELDLSYAHGDDRTDESNSLYNIALTYKNKWKDHQGITLTSEYTFADRSFDYDEDTDIYTDNMETSALSTWIQYQMNKRWWVQARYEILDKEINSEDLKKSSALIGFVPTEYSALRLQYDHTEVPGQTEDEQRVSLQLNITMGAHPAHAY